MPELPEVETTRLGITPHILGQVIDNVAIRQKNLRYPITQSIAKKLPKQKIKNISRRGKYLLIEAENGCLIVHLGMSGSLRVINPTISAGKHDHVDIIFQNDICLRYNDPRRFGILLWTEDDPLQHKLISKLGLEPLGEAFNANYLQQQLANKRTAIKQLVMNNHIVVGVGNIYANESLFAAKIHPLRPGNSLKKQEINALCRAIKTILRAAIKQGGTTLKDFRQSDGKPGYFRHNLKVYGRESLKCMSCPSTLVATKIGQRNTFFCPSCQL